MDYNDVTKQIRKSKRITDPMNPNYTLRDTMTGEFTKASWGPVNNSYGVIFGNRPAQVKNISGVRNLQTTDITGA